MIYVRSTPPALLPVTLALFKQQLRLEADESFEDLLLQSYLEAAVAHLDGRDGILGRCLVDQVWTAYAEGPVRLPCGRAGFRLELGPVRSDLTVSVRYWAAGEYQDVDPGHYRVEQERLEEASVVLAPGASWPAAEPVRNAWRIDFVAGFGAAAAAVPAPLQAAILLLATDLANDRSGKTLASLVTNPTVDRLIAPYRKVAV
ncbi:head-tail connector protein [Enterovirga rhinocerotis]|uniref:Putative phiE125 gp8 family phage protein n=1 Tax=Enterovirga rhinocerotis TaxID=1339210 RepID=A0A4R7C6I6_9HYPH|nr:hypothetical protein [Enterovirga rhinocerotis]TDR94200.1 putative phiE125 gp8 family phage protein [Enterovirga rhinocerotis]